MPSQTCYFIDQISFTPTNIKKVNKIKKLVLFFRNQIFDLLKLIILHKTLKVVRYIIANKVIFNHINIKLLAAYIEKK